MATHSKPPPTWRPRLHPQNHDPQSPTSAPTPAHLERHRSGDHSPAGRLRQPQRAAPTPAAWSSQQLGLNASASTPVATDWWTRWGDASLQALIRQALQDHPSMQQAAARVRRMQASANAAGAAELQQVGLGADFSRQRYSANGLFPKPIAGNTWNNDTLQVSLGWMPDLWGEHAAALAAAVGQTRAAEAEAAMASQLLAAQILRSSIGLARLLAQLDTSTQLIELRWTPTCWAVAPMWWPHAGAPRPRSSKSMWPAPSSTPT